MKICKFGIKLIRLRKEHLELVRKWRNDAKVSQYMEYKEYITSEMQLNWFKSIDNIYNSYYIIEYKGEYIGLVNDKNINFEERSSEAGLFIWEKKYLNTYAPVLASLCMIEVGFHILQGEKSYIKVHKDNSNALAFNKKLGFEIIEENTETGFLTLCMNRSGYEKKALKLMKAAISLNPDLKLSEIIMEPHDYTEGIGNFTEKLIQESPVDFKNRIEGENIIYYYNWEI